MNIDTNELCHFGIKGQKGGIRRFQNKNGSLTEQGKKRYSDSSGSRTSSRKKAGEDARSTQGEVKRYGKDAANSAARTYYRIQNLQKKQGKVDSFREYRDLGEKIAKKQSHLDLKTASLTDEQVKNGRYRIARNREIRRTAASALTGGASGAMLIAAGGGFLGIPVAAGVYAGTKLASGGYYYKRQAYNYKNYNVEKNKREQKSK